MTKILILYLEKFNNPGKIKTCGKLRIEKRRKINLHGTRLVTPIIEDYGNTADESMYERWFWDDKEVESGYKEKKDMEMVCTT